MKYDAIVATVKAEQVARIIHESGKCANGSIGVVSSSAIEKSMRMAKEMDAKLRDLVG